MQSEMRNQGFKEKDKPWKIQSSDLMSFGIGWTTYRCCIVAGTGQLNLNVACKYCRGIRI